MATMAINAINLGNNAASAALAAAIAIAVAASD
jgi:hypothetical protein